MGTVKFKRENRGRLSSIGSWGSLRNWGLMDKLNGKMGYEGKDGVYRGRWGRWGLQEFTVKNRVFMGNIGFKGKIGFTEKLGFNGV